VLPRVGTNVPLSVETDQLKGDNICFVREVQRHPVTEEILHVDFLRVDVSQAIRAEVPIAVEGTAPAVRNLGGTLLRPLQTILIESLPMNVPSSLSIDVSDLDDFEKAVYVRDVSVDPNVTVVTDQEELLARVSPPRIEIVEEAGEPEEGIEEGEQSVAVEGQVSTEPATAT
jgi:large subunit ribosomal protein L25